MTTNLETSLHGTESKEVEYEQGSDRMDDKKSRVIRIAVQNVRGIGKTRRGVKNKEWERLTEEYGIDCFCFGEVNVDWRTIGTEDRIENRVRGWWGTACTNFSNNVTEKSPVQSNTAEQALRLSRSLHIGCWTVGKTSPDWVGGRGWI